MIRYEKMAEAARFNDALAEERGPADTVERLGVNYLDAVRISEQRALRMALIVTGDLERLRRMTAANVPHPVPLSTEQKRLKQWFQVVFLDGLTCGVRAEQEEANRP